MSWGDEKEKRNCAQVAANMLLKCMAVEGDSSVLPPDNSIWKNLTMYDVVPTSNAHYHMYPPSYLDFHGLMCTTFSAGYSPGSLAHSIVWIIRFKYLHGLPESHMPYFHVRHWASFFASQGQTVSG